MEMITKQLLSLFLCFLSIITQSISARTLSTPPSTYYHHAHHAISFYMPDVLNHHDHKHPLSKPATTNAVNRHNPFSKPSSATNPTPSTTTTGGGVSSRPLEVEGIISMSFPGISTLQELEMGTVTTIDEDIYGGIRLELIGKIEGMYVAGSEDGNSSHMMAVTASFGGGINEYNNNDYDDKLRFFGVHRSGDVVESHIAVIGGNGKYFNANGYATVKTAVIHSSSSNVKRNVLEFNVYLG